MAEPEDFRALLESSEATPRPQRGDVLSGRVVALDTQGMIVDLGLKRDGVVPRAELDKLREEGVQFEVDQEGQCASVRQVAVFHPAGYVGVLYWYLLYPVHSIVFSGMLRGIKRQIDALPSSTRPVEKAKHDGGGEQARDQDRTEPEAKASATLHLGRCSLE